jgi:hypothetical protein
MSTGGVGLRDAVCLTLYTSRESNHADNPGIRDPSSRLLLPELQRD